MRINPKKIRHNSKVITGSSLTFTVDKNEEPNIKKLTTMMNDMYQEQKPIIKKLSGKTFML